MPCIFWVIHAFLAQALGFELSDFWITYFTFVISSLGYERVYLPPHKVADTPFHIQGTIYFTFVIHSRPLQRALGPEACSLVILSWGHCADLIQPPPPPHTHTRPEEDLAGPLILLHSDILWGEAPPDIHPHLTEDGRDGPSPADTRRWINVGLTLVQRRRRWTNFKPALIQRFVSAGLLNLLPCRPLRGLGWMYLLYPKNPTWRWLWPQGPKNAHNFLMTVRPLSWACRHGTEMLLILKKLFLTWLLPEEMSHDFVRG